MGSDPSDTETDFSLECVSLEDKDHRSFGTDWNWGTVLTEGTFPPNPKHSSSESQNVILWPQSFSYVKFRDKTSDLKYFRHHQDRIEENRRNGGYRGTTITTRTLLTIAWLYLHILLFLSLSVSRTYLRRQKKFRISVLRSKRGKTLVDFFTLSSLTLGHCFDCNYLINTSRSVIRFDICHNCCEINTCMYKCM